MRRCAAGEGAADVGSVRAEQCNRLTYLGNGPFGSVLCKRIGQGRSSKKATRKPVAGQKMSKKMFLVWDGANLA